MNELEIFNFLIISSKMYQLAWSSPTAGLASVSWLFKIDESKRIATAKIWVISNARPSIEYFKGPSCADNLFGWTDWRSSNAFHLLYFCNFIYGTVILKIRGTVLSLTEGVTSHSLDFKTSNMRQNRLHAVHATYCPRKYPHTKIAKPLVCLHLREQDNTYSNFAN